MRGKALLAFLFLAFTGCVQIQMLPYLDQALTLQGFSEEKDAQHDYVHSVDAKFDKLLAALQSGDIQRYQTQNDIAQTFGPPILSKNVMRDGKALKECLYRYTIQSKSPRKVYLYFDGQGRLVKWEKFL